MCASRCSFEVELLAGASAPRAFFERGLGSGNSAVDGAGRAAFELLGAAWANAPSASVEVTPLAHVKQLASSSSMRSTRTVAAACEYEA